MMERLGFESAQLMTPIKDLSGGQKRRMQLLLILLDEPNVAQSWMSPATIWHRHARRDGGSAPTLGRELWIVVSHDRYLLERVTDQQFALIGRQSAPPTRMACRIIWT